LIYIRYKIIRFVAICQFIPSVCVCVCVSGAPYQFGKVHLTDGMNWHSATNRTIL